MTTADDMTLDELRRALGPLLPAEAAFDGWSEQAVDAAAQSLGVHPDRAQLAVGNGAVERIDCWFESVDSAIEHLDPGALAQMRIRQRIAALVMARIELVAPHREALRRALAILALPSYAPHAARLAWRAADGMWRLAGDRSTGFAYYSKRLTLVAVYGATLLALLEDESEELADTRAFLDRRIGDVMRFEQIKARLKPDPERRFNVTRFLGRLRYPHP